MCEDPVKCNYPDKYSGYDGAIRCLVENGGDVAFTKVIYVRKFFGVSIVSKFFFGMLLGTILKTFVSIFSSRSVTMKNQKPKLQQIQMTTSTYVKMVVENLLQDQHAHGLNVRGKVIWATQI